MTQSRKALLSLSSGILAACIAHNASAAIITQWSFPATASPPDNNPAPTTGVGSTVTLGMTNAYVYSGGETTPTTANDDIVVTSGTANTAFTENTWRIRGANNKSGQPGNGWNNSAPNYTQGAQFNVPTVGYTPTEFSFDWYATSSGVANLQVQYSLDGVNFTNLGADLIATSNDYYGGASTVAGTPNVSISLTGLPAGAANDPNFALQLVSVKPVSTDANYASTNGDGNYAAANGVDYNNNSGNWRFDNITVAGDAASPIPEPASASLLALAAVGLLARRRNKIA